MSEHVCPWWLAYTFDNPLRYLLHKPERIFAPYVRPGMTVADIGCGFGYFAIGLATLIGSTGKVLAVDIQPRMLQKAQKRAAKAGVADRIEFRQCLANDIGIAESLDFALAFWMLHETPDAGQFLRQIHGLLRPAAQLMITEPIFHVSAGDFTREMDLAEKTGFSIRETPPINLCRTAILAKEGE